MKTFKQALGIFLLSLPITVIFIICVIDGTVMVVFGTTAVIVLPVILGAYLLTNQNQND